MQVGDSYIQPHIFNIYTDEVASIHRETNTTNHNQEHETNQNERETVTNYECIIILLTSFRHLFSTISKDFFQFLMMLSFLFFPTEISVLILISNFVYHMLPDTEPPKPPEVQKARIPPDVEKIKSSYSDLELQSTNKRKLRTKINKLRNNRKKEDLRDSTSSDSDTEEEVSLSEMDSPLNPSAKFTLTGRVGNTNVAFLIDSGSSISLLNKATFNSIDKRDILKVKTPDRTFRDYNGGIINMLTLVTIQVEFANTLVTHDFYVTQKEDSTNILGVDIMRSKRMSINHGENHKVFVSFHHTDNMTQKRIPVDENQILPLFVTETTEITPGTNFVNVCFAPDSVNFINSNELHNIVGLTQPIVDPFSNDEYLSAVDTNGCLTMPIHNNSFGSSMVFKGQRLGSFQPLQKHTELYNRELDVSEIIGEDYRPKPNLQNSINYLQNQLNKKKQEEVDTIKLTNNEMEESSAVEESDLGDELYQPRRIPDSKAIWEELLLDVPEHLRKSVFEMLTVKYPSAVASHSQDFGDCKLPGSEFTIKLEDEIPFETKPYPLNFVYSSQIKEVIDEMVEQKLLIPESSNYGSGVFVRPRPDHTNSGNARIRIINDYRQLNSKCLADLYPIPNLKMILQRMNGKKFFILMDLKDSYQAIRIAEKDRYKASIVTSFGQFTPTRMMFGYKNAPPWFSRQLHRAIHDVEDATNYLDDILCAGDTPEECLRVFEEVLKRLVKAGFKISLAKLQMFKSNLKILGVNISQDGIRSDEAKIQAVKQFPVPQTKTDVQKFLGIANYLSDFIPGFSLKAAPLFKLAGGNEDKVTLDKDQLNSFHTIKDLVVKPTVLAFIDPAKPIYVETDASSTGYAGCAYQVEVYTEQDIPQLKAEYESIFEKSKPQLDDELRNIINRYTGNEDIPEYESKVNPSVATETKEEHFSPFLNSTLKMKKANKKIYIPRVCFFFSRKFNDTQIRCWSSLMKELGGLLDIIERRAEFLALALRTIVLTDCSALIYLYNQSKSNSILSRYLSRLNNYQFSVLVKHKPGEKLVIADVLSRVHVLENESSNPEKVDHKQGIIVKNPFRAGQLITAQDIITYLQSSENQVVMSSSDPRITRACQTTSCQDPDPPECPSDVCQILGLREKLINELNDVLTFDNYSKAQQEEYKILYSKLLTSEVPDYKISNGIILHKIKGKFLRLTPTALRNAVLSRFHLLGHMGAKKMKKLIQQTDHWPAITKDCKDFTSKCISCIWIRPKTGERHELGYPLTGNTADVWMMDVVSMPNSNGFKFFVSVIDTFSRFCVTFPLREDKASEIVRNLEQKVFGVFGSPRVMITDGAQNLGKAKQFQYLCNLYRTEVKVRSPYSSRSLGLCERVHRSILDKLRSLNDSFQNTWTSNLALATAIYNTAPHTATKLSPFHLMFGRENNMWNPLPPPSDLPLFQQTVEEHHKTLRQDLEILNEQAKTEDKVYKDQMRSNFKGKHRDYKPGSFILSQNKLPAVNENIKMRPKFYGPFLVLANLDSVVIAENVRNGRVSYHNKDLIKGIAEKSVEKYESLPYFSKMAFGSGFTNKSWEKLYHDNKLFDAIKNKNIDILEFGLEHPIEKMVSYKEVITAKDEVTERRAHLEPSSSDDIEEPTIPEAAPNSQPTRKVHWDKTIPDQPRRSSRAAKAPNRLNL